MRKKTKSFYTSKMKLATHMLFYRRHQKPGVKGWELRKSLGVDYLKILKILDEYLKSLDLKVKTVFEKEEALTKEPSREELDKARFYITLRGDLTPKETKMIGWRIDDLAGLAVTIAYIMSKRGQTARSDVERILGEKIPDWKVRVNLDRYIRYGYLHQDDNGQLYLDWRTRVEIDEKSLISCLLRSNAQNNLSFNFSKEKN